MTEEEARNYRINPFDLTKVWLHLGVEVFRIAVQFQDTHVLQRKVAVRPDFGQIERVAVHSYHRDGAMRVDGNFGATVSYTPNSYGVWSNLIEIHAQAIALCVAVGKQPSLKHLVGRKADAVDGAMRVDGNFGATVSYTPNSYGVWSDSPELKEPPLPLHGPVDNYDERAYDDDYYSQPGALFRLMTPEEKSSTFLIKPSQRQGGARGRSSRRALRPERLTTTITRNRVHCSA